MNRGLCWNAVGITLLACSSLLLSVRVLPAQSNIYFSVTIASFSPNQLALQVNVPGGGPATVQASVNGVVWTALGSVNGAGTIFDAAPASLTSRFYRGVKLGPPGDPSPQVPGFFHIALRPGLNAVANQLVAPGTNSVAQWTIYPAIPDGLSIQKFTPSGGFDNYYFQDGQTYSPLTFAAGESFLVNNPATNILNLYLVGNAPGLVQNSLPAGWSLCGSMFHNILDLASGFPAADGDEIFRISPLVSAFEPYAFYDSGLGGWVDAASFDIIVPTFPPGQAFWVAKSAPALWYMAGIESAVNISYWTEPALASSPGQAALFTWNSDPHFGLVLGVDGVTPAGGTLRAEVRGGTNAAYLVTLASGLSFGSGTNAGYLNAGTVAVPGSDGGQTGYFQLRVWDIACAASYAAAVSNGCPRGQSELFHVTLGAPISGGFPAEALPALNTFHSFPISAFAPEIITQPANQLVAPGNVATFTVEAVGAPPLGYQWRFNGTNLADNTRITGSQSASLTVSNVGPSDVGNYQVLITNLYGSVTSVLASLTLTAPPGIVAQPQSQTVPIGTNVVFTVIASGSPPLTYHWRLNGQNIPGATNSVLQISNVQATNGGTYTVVVGNPEGAITSDPAVLVVSVPGRPIADNFVDRVPLLLTSGVVSGTNSLATRESGEPIPADKPGGKSVWYTWQAPADGIIAFTTAGSTFDTLLGVYQGSIVSNLAEVVSDDDRGGFFASLARFNVVAGQQYEIAVDGYGGASGYFVLSWNFQATPEQLPKIANQPQSATVAPGTNYTFYVTLQFPQLSNTFQWLFNGVPIAGATGPSNTIANVQMNSVGIYSVQVSLGAQTVQSLAASLQINLTEQAVQPVLAYDKLLDAVASPYPLVLGNPEATQTATRKSSPHPRAAGTVVRGYTGSQVFNTFAATTGVEDENYCGVVCGASEWIKFVAQQDGVLFLSTQGSTYDAVIAIFGNIGGNPALVQLDCDHDGSPDHTYSLLNVPVQAGTTNFLVVDGVRGATGVLVLNYSLLTPTRLVYLGKTVSGAAHLQVMGRTGMKFALQSAPNLFNWSSLLTTNSDTNVFDFLDASPSASAARFYRALMLP